MRIEDAALFGFYMIPPTLSNSMGLHCALIEIPTLVTIYSI